MLKPQQASPELQNALPRSKQVNPEFQKALKGAIQNFRTTKALWKHHLDEIAIMERVVNNANQTNRELRDGARRACQEINSSWRNWVVSSLLTDYVTEVLDNPRFNVEKIYEALIDELDKTIGLQDKVIEKLELENKKWREDPQYYNQDLQKKLDTAEDFFKEAKHELCECKAELAQSRQLNKELKTMLEANKKNHQVLCKDYLQAMDEQQPSTKKQFKAPPRQAGRPCSEISIGGSHLQESHIHNSKTLKVNS
jgi:hypothetical protein